jgi:hypothetical protein
MEENQCGMDFPEGNKECPRKRKFMIRPISSNKKPTEAQQLGSTLIAGNILSPTKKTSNKERSISMVDLSPNKMRNLVQVPNTPGMSKFGMNQQPSSTNLSNVSSSSTAALNNSINTSTQGGGGPAPSNSQSKLNPSQTNNMTRALPEPKSQSPLKKKVAPGGYERFDFQKSLRSSLNYVDFQKEPGANQLVPPNHIPINTNKGFEIKLKKPLTSTNPSARSSVITTNINKTHSTFFSPHKGPEENFDDEKFSPSKFRYSTNQPETFHLPKINTSPMKPKSGEFLNLLVLLKRK